MNNMVLTNMKFWDPNSRLGDAQLMALASWLVHEEARAKEVKKFMAKEESEPLCIIAELPSPKVVIRNHSLISANPKLAPRYLEKQEQAILHFEDIFRILGTKSLQACHRRWHDLPHNLQIREYHYPKKLRNAL